MNIKLKFAMNRRVWFFLYFTIRLPKRGSWWFMMAGSNGHAPQARFRQNGVASSGFRND
ncbi:MAG: hypothetical protein OXG88_03890 [Gammaproteobacteria bacterium]|nr:hypothetical protein [Gammaproteobacteria bacterium]